MSLNNQDPFTTFTSPKGGRKATTLQFLLKNTSKSLSFLFVILAKETESNVFLVELKLSQKSNLIEKFPWDFQMVSLESNDHKLHGILHFKLE